jgi:hypothetical protein
MRIRETNHRQVVIKIKGVETKVDAKLGEVLSSINRLPQVTTIYSCQGTNRPTKYPNAYLWVKGRRAKSFLKNVLEEELNVKIQEGKNYFPIVFEVERVGYCLRWYGIYTDIMIRLLTQAVKQQAKKRRPQS